MIGLRALKTTRVSSAAALLRRLGVFGSGCDHALPAAF